MRDMWFAGQYSFKSMKGLSAVLLRKLKHSMDMGLVGAAPLAKQKISMRFVQLSWICEGLLAFHAIAA